MKFEWGSGKYECGKLLGYPEVGKIDSITARGLEIFEDDRGFLSEVCRTDWPEVGRTMPNDISMFQQVYIVGNHEKGTVRAFHKHERLVDFFIIASGAAKFVLFDDDPESRTFGRIQTIIASANKLKMITVPTNVYHGWQSLKEDTLLLSVANRLYMGINKLDELDEHRIDWDTFGKKIWEVEYK